MAFSKSNIKVSTWPWLSKIFAQSSIIVISRVSQLCHFLNACFFLTRVYVHPDEP